MKKPLWETHLQRQLLKGRGAPFYVIRPSPQMLSPREELLIWHRQFLESYVAKACQLDGHKARLKIQQGHPDLINIIPPEPLKAYKMETNDLQEVFKTQNFKPTELPQKCITVADGQAITEKYANKMLKTLEEPQEKTSIFFLLNSHRSLLPTIQSRAICLSLPSPPKTEQDQENEKLINPTEMMSWFHKKFKEDPSLWKKYGLLWEAFLKHPEEHFELLDHLKRDQNLQDRFFQLTLQWHQGVASDYLAKNRILREIKWFQRALTFHNSPRERFFGLLCATFFNYPTSVE